MIAIGILVALAAAYFALWRQSRFAYQPPELRAPERRERGSFETVFFPACDGTRLEGWLFRPHRAHAPLVIMAGGLTATKDCGLEAYAWQFVERGIATLLFDYRCFGGSAGTPRHYVDPERQVDDYRAALKFARAELTREGVIDATRIALWGSSFSGGNALVTAATGANVQAVVVQAPYLQTPEHIEPAGMNLARFVIWAMLDSLRVLPPIYVPALGRPGEWVFAPSRENPSVRNFEGPLGSDFWRLLPKPIRGGWENRMLARVLTSIDRFEPMQRVSQIDCPILFIAAASDDLVPQTFVERAHALARASQLHVLPCGHFDLYFGEHGARNAALQASFLAERFEAETTPAAPSDGEHTHGRKECA
jgi:pimeloyl-ACP methyl ester carboxylesterase